MPWRELVGGVHRNALHPALQPPRSVGSRKRSFSPNLVTGGALYAPPGGGRRVGSGRGGGWATGKGFCGKGPMWKRTRAFRILGVPPPVQERDRFRVIVASSPETKNLNKAVGSMRDDLDVV